MPRIHLLEEKSYPYVHVDNENQVHLLVPITAGTNIGIDNTCKASSTFKEFFDQIRDILYNYCSHLQSDISALEVIPTSRSLVAEKESRKRQIEEYLININRIERSYFWDPSSQLQKILKNSVVPSRNTNCVSISLSTKRDDSITFFNNPLFFVQRATFNIFGEYTATEGLGFELRSLLQEVQIQNPKQQFIEGVVEIYWVHYQIQTIQKQELSLFLNTLSRILDAIQVKDQQEPIDMLERIKREALQTANGDIPLEETLAAYFNAVMAEDLFDYPNVRDLLTMALETAKLHDGHFSQAAPSPFNAIRYGANEEKKEKLSLAIQFFIAMINIHYYKKENENSLRNTVWSYNFGAILEENRLLLGSFLKKIRLALYSENSIEDTIFEFFRECWNCFFVSAPLGEEDINEIKEYFSITFNTIENSSHFDEFLFFLKNKRDIFYTHQGCIVIPFMTMLPFLSQKISRTLKTTPFYTAPQSISGMLPHKNEAIPNFFEYEVDTIFFDKKALKELFLLDPCKHSGIDQCLMNLEIKNFIQLEINYSFESMRLDYPAMVMERDLIDVLSQKTQARSLHYHQDLLVKRMHSLNAEIETSIQRLEQLNSFFGKKRAKQQLYVLSNVRSRLAFISHQLKEADLHKTLDCIVATKEIVHALIHNFNRIGYPGKLENIVHSTQEMLYIFWGYLRALFNLEPKTLNTTLPKTKVEYFKHIKNNITIETSIPNRFFVDKQGEGHYQAVFYSTPRYTAYKQRLEAIEESAPEEMCIQTLLEKKKKPDFIC